MVGYVAGAIMAPLSHLPGEGQVAPRCLSRGIVTQPAHVFMLEVWRRVSHVLDSFPCRAGQRHDG